jgi:hypothetical protein
MCGAFGKFCKGKNRVTTSDKLWTPAPLFVRLCEFARISKRGRLARVRSRALQRRVYDRLNSPEATRRYIRKAACIDHPEPEEVKFHTPCFLKAKLPVQFKQKIIEGIQRLPALA